jgi:hypothetical protein
MTTPFDALRSHATVDAAPAPPDDESGCSQFNTRTAPAAATEDLTDDVFEFDVGLGANATWMWEC